jgi:hypothetical protein
MLDIIGFMPCIINDALFHNKEKSILLHMHVNDGLIVGKSRLNVKFFINELKKHYFLKVKERPNQHLGYKFDWQANGSLLVHQSDFAQKILDEFDMTNATSVKAPSPLNFHRVIASESPSFDVKMRQKAVGMLNYLALHTQPDLAFTINVLAQFSSSPTVAGWSMIKHVLRYIFGSINIGIEFLKLSDQGPQLVGWADADYGTSLVTKKSMSGYVICFYGNPISWTTKKQLVVAQSITTEVEFISINKLSTLRQNSNLKKKIYLENHV